MFAPFLACSALITAEPRPAPRPTRGIAPTSATVRRAQSARVRTFLPALRTERGGYLVPGKSLTLRASLAGTDGKPLAGRRVSFRLTWRAQESKRFQDLWDTVGEAETNEQGVATVQLETPGDLLGRGKFGRARLRVAFGGDLQPTDGILYRERVTVMMVAVARESQPGKPVAVAPAVPASGDDGGVAAPPVGEPGKDGGSVAGTGSDGGGDNTNNDGGGEAKGSGDGPATGADAAATSGYPKSETEPPLALDPALLRGFLGGKAGLETAATAPSELNLSPSAVPIFQNDFRVSPPRFWLEASIIKVNVKSDGPIPQLAKTSAEAVVRLRMVDALSKANWNWTESDKSSRMSLDVKKILLPGGTLPIPSSLRKALSPSKALPKSLQSRSLGAAQEVEDINLDTVLPKANPESKILKTAITKGIATAEKHMAEMGWYTDVLSVKGGNIYINSGKGFPYKVGDTLGLITLNEESLIRDSSGNLKAMVPDLIGRLTVVRVGESFVIAKPAPGVTVRKGHLVCTPEAYARYEAEHGNTTTAN